MATVVGAILAGPPDGPTMDGLLVGIEEGVCPVGTLEPGLSVNKLVEGLLVAGSLGQAVPVVGMLIIGASVGLVVGLGPTVGVVGSSEYTEGLTVGETKLGVAAGPLEL